MNDEDVLLSVQDLRVYFHTKEGGAGEQGGLARALDGVSYNISSGEIVCLVGESGCGKTVSALAIIGLIDSPPGEIAGGRVIFKGQNLLELSEEKRQAIRGNRIAMVFQEPLTSLNPVLTVGDQIGETLRLHKGLRSEDIRHRSIQLLRDVGIPSPEARIKDYPHQLSGGQRQRAMIAMALACEPELIIADEPTTALDVTIQAQILNLFKSLQKSRGMSVLYITHDLRVVSDIADRIYVMYAGVIAEEGNRDQVFYFPRHPYTQGLLASLPTPSKRGKRLSVIPGSVPDPSRKPEGCPFHPRCSLALQACREELPGIYDFGLGHKSRCPVVYHREIAGKVVHD